MGQKDVLEEAMATPSSILIWRIPHQSLEGFGARVAKGQAQLKRLSTAQHMLTFYLKALIFHNIQCIVQLSFERCICNTLPFGSILKVHVKVTTFLSRVIPDFK